jgi:hypothetical protein
MSCAPRPPHSSPPVLVGTLGLAALLCGMAGLWLEDAQVRALVAEKIRLARGSMSPGTEAWLDSLSFRGLMLNATAACGVCALLLWRKGPAWRAWLTARAEAAGRKAETASDGAGLTAVLGAGAVVVRYFQTLPHGFFRYDDFDLVSTAHQHPWWRGLWIPHGDHFLPGTRLAASAFYALFGVSPWPYNLGVVLVMAAAVVLGCLVLGALGVCRPAQWLFIGLVVPWSPWAEIMSGYYILSSYTFIAALGLAVTWCYLRWRSKGRVRHAAGIVLGTFAATLVDISGWYVPAALGVFILADFANRPAGCDAKSWLGAHSRLIGGTALACSLSLAATVHAYAFAHQGLFLSMGKTASFSASRLLADFAYLFDVGLLVSLVTPFVYARLPPALLGVLATAVLLGWTAFMIGTLRLATRRQRVTLAGLALVMAGICLMVNLGRPSEETVIVRWAAKHVGAAFIWLCLLASFAWHLWWCHAGRERRIVLAEITLVGIGGYWCAQAAFGHLGLAVAFPPFGYPAEIRDSIDRRQAIAEIAEKVWSPISSMAGSSSGLTVPTLDGPFLASHCPGLFDYNLATYLPFFSPANPAVTLVRNAQMHPWTGPGTVTVSSLRAAVSGEFMNLIRHNAGVRSYYFSRIPLRSMARPDPHLMPRTHVASEPAGPLTGQSEGFAQFTEDGRRLYWVRRTAFDPESAPVLRISLEGLPPAGPGEVAVRLEFTTDIADATGGGTITLPARPDDVIETDLRQLYAFSLSRQVRDVRLMVTTPGDYRLRMATLSR